MFLRLNVQRLRLLLVRGLRRVWRRRVQLLQAPRKCLGLIRIGRHLGRPFLSVQVECFGVLLRRRGGIRVLLRLSELKTLGSKELFEA